MPRIDRIVMAILGVVVLGATLCLSACDALKPDPQRLAESRAVYDQLVRDDIAGLQARMVPEAKAQATAAEIEKVRKYIPAGNLLHVQNIGWNAFSSGSEYRVTISDEYEYPQAYAVFESQFYRAPGASQDQLVGFHLQMATRAQLQVNKLTLENRSWQHYALAAYALLELLIILAAVIHIVRNRSKGWILWLIAALFGVGQFRFDWTTGATDFQLLYVSLLGVGIMRGISVFSHWVLSVSFPLFAVMALAQRGKFVRYKKEKAVRRYAAMDMPPETPPQNPLADEPPHDPPAP